MKTSKASSGASKPGRKPLMARAAGVRSALKHRSKAAGANLRANARQAAAELPKPKPITVRSSMRRKLRIIIPAAAMLIFLASIATVQFATRPTSNEPTKHDTKSYQESLKAQVDNTDGSPVSGRNPASQSQTSLSTAASTPSGTGTRTDNVASGVAGSTGNAKAAPSTADQQKTGINSAGCFFDYGIPGQECVPASMANSDGTLSCTGVRMHFPKGVKVSGTDRFHLDANHDGTACGSGD